MRVKKLITSYKINKYFYLIIYININEFRILYMKTGFDELDYKLKYDF